MRKPLRIATFALVAIGAAGTGIAVLMPASVPAVAREAVVYKSPTCGCCGGWVTYLQRHGFEVTVHDRDDMDMVKADMKVPDAMQSCHTARIDGYVVEGHVPVEAIDKLLTERPNVTGIAAPGMPSGSPGMNGPKEPNPVFTFGDAGQKPFGTY